jgi:hypothetical protein
MGATADSTSVFPSFRAKSSVFSGINGPKAQLKMKMEHILTVA